MIRITVVVENTVFRQGLLAEHGLSYYIQKDKHSVLFDTGQGLVFANNTQALNIDLKAVNTVVISHGHYDHTGGLRDVLEQTVNATLIAHPNAFTEKFRPIPDGGIKDVGMPVSSRAAIKQHLGSINQGPGPQTVTTGIHVTGEIPFGCPFEPAPRNFFTDRELTQPDLLLDDRAMWIETDVGLVILLGCAHRGVINTIDTITDMAGTNHIHTLAGGMHLAAAGKDRIEQTVRALSENYTIEHIYPGHCTGLPAQLALHQAFGPACHQLFTGLVIEIK